MNLVRTLAVGGVLLALVAVTVEAAGGASKKTQSLIVGKWKMEKKQKLKADKEVSTSIIAEFSKDGKLKLSFKIGEPLNKDFDAEGTYKLIDDTTLETTVAEPGKKEAKTDKMKIEMLSKTKLVLLRGDKEKQEKLEFERVK